MVLERLVRSNDEAAETARAADGVLLERANLLANLYVGNSVLSSFELFRGYSPSLVGMPSRFVTEKDVEAHVQLTTTRAISRMLPSKTFNPYVKLIIAIGQVVYVHTRNRPSSARGAVGWAKHVVYKLEPDFVCTRPVGRDNGIYNKSSYADVRVPPKSPLAHAAFEFALRQPLSRLGRCGDRPEDGTDIDVAPAEEPREIAEPPPVVEPQAASLFSRLDENALTRNGDDVGQPERDIGSEVLLEPDEATLKKADEQRICSHILETIGRVDVTRSKLSFVPSWIIAKALEEELEGWDPHIEVLPLAGSPKRSVIGSHVLYRVKTRENGEHYLKGRLVLHGNQEEEKESLRTDASLLHFALLRLILSFTVCLGFILGGVDASKAYHQSGSPPRDVHVRPPVECMMYRCVWLLSSLPYGLVDAGRLWQLAMEAWLLDNMGFISFLGLPQVFALLNDKNQIQAKFAC